MCSYCYRSYISRGALRRHVRDRHEPSNAVRQVNAEFTRTTGNVSKELIKRKYTKKSTTKAKSTKVSCTPIPSTISSDDYYALGLQNNVPALTPLGSASHLRAIESSIADNNINGAADALQERLVAAEHLDRILFGDQPTPVSHLSMEDITSILAIDPMVEQLAVPLSPLDNASVSPTLTPVSTIDNDNNSTTDTDIVLGLSLDHSYSAPAASDDIDIESIPTSMSSPDLNDLELTPSRLGALMNLHDYDDSSDEDHVMEQPLVGTEDHPTIPVGYPVSDSILRSLRTVLQALDPELARDFGDLKLERTD